jgi:geranylgeranyl diphosphate synthase type II
LRAELEAAYPAIYEKHQKVVEEILSGLLKNKKPQSLYEPCSYIMQSGGKRIRPLLVLISAKAAGSDYEYAYNASVAVELLHNFTLVHDDIMDNANLRRGISTLHVKYDLSTAILAGDSLLAIAYTNLLNDCRNNTKEIIATFTNALIEVCEGQSLDKEFELRDNVTIDEYIIMICKKTAALLETCCKIGGQIAGGDEKIINALSNYGRNLGIAFQIQDDLLDITADEVKFGKFIGGDLVEGKKTYLFLKALEKATGKDLELLNYCIKNKGIEKSEINKFKRLYYDLGVIEDTNKAISDYTALALKEIEILGNEKGMLTWLANSLIKRNK